MSWRGWFITYIIITLFSQLSVAEQTCCSDELEDDELAAQFNLQTEFSTIQLSEVDNLTQWELQVNISWSRVEGYDRYIVEIEAVNNSVDAGLCNFFLTCPFDGLWENNWRIFSGIQFGSVQRVTMFVTEVLETKRGPYIRNYPDSPDCYDETESIDFCKTQPVQYAGKPIEVEVANMTINDEDRVIVTIGWRQPVHINAITPLSYYQIFWFGEETETNNIKLTDVEFNPGEYVITVFEEPLFLNTSYTLQVGAVVNENGFNQRGLFREFVFITLPPTVITLPAVVTNSNALLIALVVSGSVVLIVTVILLLLKKSFSERFDRLRKEDEDDILDLDVIIPKHSKRRPTLIAYPAYELARSDIFWTERKELGRGYYGEVYKCSATIDGMPTEAAVKVPKQFATSTEIEDFVHEISLVIKLGNHPNLVKFLGCCTTSDPLMMVNEFVRYGDLFSFMQKIKNKKAPKERIYDIQPLDLLNMARQIARGMEYIASQRCVHGDLAARNILVDEDLVVKITDFGLSRDVYASNYVRLTKEAKLPWKWYSIEAMTGERKLTTKGDVWSYGIVLFELFTFCDPPYPLIPSLSALVEFLESGRRMKQPIGCPDSVYSIMMKCWNTNPNKRPTFTQLVAEFEKLIGAESVSDYLPIFESGDVTLTNPKIEQLSRSNISLVDKSLTSETSSISTQNENHTLDARSDMSQEDAGYENILISESATYTTDINGDIVLNDGVWVQPEEGYIEPMKNDEKEDDKYAHSKARKINSLKDTKYDVLPPLQSKGDNQYMREDSNGYMAPTDVETTKMDLKNDKNNEHDKKYDVFIKNADDIQFENELIQQDNEGYTEIDEDENKCDVLFENQLSTTDNDGYTEIDEAEDGAPKNNRSPNYGDIIFENEINPDNDGYTEIDDDNEDNKVHTKERQDDFSKIGNEIQGYWSTVSQNETNAQKPKQVDRDDIYFGKETKEKKRSVINIDNKYSSVFVKKNPSEVDEKNKIPYMHRNAVHEHRDKVADVMASNGNDKNVLGDPEEIYFGKEAVYRQDSKGYALPDDVEDEDGKDLYLDDTRNVRIPNLRAEDLNDVYFGKEDIYRQDSKGYTLPDDEDGEKFISTKHTTKDNVIDVLFDNDTSKLEENNEGYLLPTGNKETKQVKHKHMERELKKYEIVEYENVTSINVMKLATEDKRTKEVEAKDPVEALYVNSKVDPDLWRTTAHKYF